MNKRSFYVIILCIIIMISTISCTKSHENINENIVDNNITVLQKSQNIKQSFFYQQVEFGKGTIDKIMAIIDNNIVYFKYADNDTVISYFNYDMDTDTTYKLGDIKNPYINSGEVAQIEKKLYFYMNEMVSDDNNPDGKLETTLYEIDIEANTLQSIITDQIDKTLVYIDVLDDNIVSFKGRNENNYGIGYIDSIDVNKKRKEQSQKEILLSAKYDNDKGEGNLIYNFTQSNNFLYTLEAKVVDVEKRIFTIKQYDSKGKFVREIELEKAITDILKGERVSNLKIVGQYAFIRTFSGAGVLCDISNNVAVARLIDNEELDVAYGAENGKEANHILIYSRNKGDMWLLDIKTSTLYSLDVNFENIEYVVIDNTTNILISAFNDDDTKSSLLYLNYMDIPIKDSIAFTNGVTLFND